MSTTNLAGKRLLICEEALIDYNGHYYNWIKAIRDIHLKQGVDVIVACNRAIDAEILKEFNAIPTYSRNSWGGIYFHRIAVLRYLGVFFHNFRVWRENAALLRTTGHVDCIILPTVRIHHLLAWRFLAARGVPDRFGRLIAFLFPSYAVYDKDYRNFGFTRSSSMLRCVLKSFRRYVRQGSVVLAGDSHITCKEYEVMTGLPCRTFPSPVAGFQTEAIRTPRPSPTSQNALLFGFLGVSVIDKGIDILQTAIIKLLEKKPHLPVRFVIQWGTPVFGYDGKLVPISTKLRLFPQVELIERPLDATEYASVFHRADVIVLPYRLRTYFNRGSGVLVEAACSGKPVIVTENTWLAWAMRDWGAGLEVKDGDPEDLCRALEEAFRRAADLGEQARLRRRIALDAHSTERYLECVWS